MTDEMMNLRALLEKSSDADLLREMIGFTAQMMFAGFDTPPPHTSTG
jgi:putative transposase